MSQDQPTKRPSFIAYTVRQGGEDTKAYFNRIGAAFAHKDGEGHDILLYAVPVDGRITLRTPQERSQEPGSGKDEALPAGGPENRRQRASVPNYER